MAGTELDDTVDALDAKETEHVIPAGIYALFGGLIVWGTYYFVAYVGWDQTADVKGGGAGLGANLTHTIAYTAIPAAVVIALAVAMSRRARARRR